MKKNIWILALLAIGVLPLPAKNLVVRVVRTEVRSKPDFLSTTLLQLRKGNVVEKLKDASKKWIYVRCSNGQKGYIHQTALETTSATLTGLIPGERGERNDDLALAAKGFNEATEKKVRSGSGFNYGDLDWVLKRKTDEGKLIQFVEEGKLK